MFEEIADIRPGSGHAPAIIGINTKYPQNASRMQRICSAYGIGELWLTGSRWADGWVSPKGKRRPPREERMRDYAGVRVIRYLGHDPLRAFGPDVTPVAVEVLPGAQCLPWFVHPENAVYVFGPEDGSLPDGIKRNCHQHVIIPTYQCLNLADACGQVLYDRMAKRLLADPQSMPEIRDRGFLDEDRKLEWNYDN